MPQKIFSLIKTSALISNSLFYSDELVTFSPVVNAQCQSNMASMRQILRHVRGKFKYILTEMGYLHAPKNILFD